MVSAEIRRRATRPPRECAEVGRGSDACFNACGFTGSSGARFSSVFLKLPARDGRSGRRRWRGSDPIIPLGASTGREASGIPHSPWHREELLTRGIGRVGGRLRGGRRRILRGSLGCARLGLGSLHVGAGAGRVNRVRGRRRPPRAVGGSVCGPPRPGTLGRLRPAPGRPCVHAQCRRIPRTDPGIRRPVFGLEPEAGLGRLGKTSRLPANWGGQKLWTTSAVLIRNDTVGPPECGARWRW